MAEQSHSLKRTAMWFKENGVKFNEMFNLIKETPWWFYIALFFGAIKVTLYMTYNYWDILPTIIYLVINFATFIMITLVEDHFASLGKRFLSIVFKLWKVTLFVEMVFSFLQLIGQR